MSIPPLQVSKQPCIDQFKKGATFINEKKTIDYYSTWVALAQVKLFSTLSKPLEKI